jgi:3-methyl-2-oxobutanoate hydroxymethyltransferase
MGDRVTIKSIVEKKTRGERIAMLTAYDYPVAQALDQAGVDVVLVGDAAVAVAPNAGA